MNQLTIFFLKDMISSSSLTNYDIKPSTNLNGKSASAINATSPTSFSNFYSLKSSSLNLSLSSSKPKISPKHSSKFVTSNTCNQNDFYFRSLMRYVRSGNNDNFSEKLDFILKLCPQFYTNMSKLNPQSNSPITNLNGDKNVNIHHKEYKDNHHQFFNHTNHFKINERNRWALIALLILIIENNHSQTKNLKKIEKKERQLNSELLNYLLAILESLPHIKWSEDFITENSCEINGTSKIRKFLLLI